MRKNQDAAGYTEADMAEVMDHPNLTDEELATAKPFSDVFPIQAETIRKTRGKQKAPTKQLVSLRLDPAIIRHFKADGPGWQVRMSEVLKASSGLQTRSVKASRTK